MFKINTARKFRYNTVCLFVAYTLISMLTACKNPLLEIIKTEVEIAVTPPTISAYYPTTEATGIPSNAELSITFSKNIDPETVSSSTFPVTNQAGTPVGGRYTVQDSTITFTPTGGFALGASYNATITRNILDTDGRSISETFSWSFTTDLPADLEPPVLSSLSFSRANIYSISGLDWTGLLSHEVVISAADNRSISHIMLSENSTLLDATLVPYSSTMTYTFQSPGGLKNLYAKVKDGAGNFSEVLKSDDIWIDITAPEVTNFLINKGASGTNSTTVSLDIFVTDSGASSGLGRFRYHMAGTEWPDWPLEPNLIMESGVGRGTIAEMVLDVQLGETAYIEVQAMDKTGNISLAVQQSIRYEQTPPTILDINWDDTPTFPYNGSMLRLVFDEEMDTASFTETRFVLEQSYDSLSVPGMISVVNWGTTKNAAVELWGLELKPNTNYKVRLNTEVTDIAGNMLGGSSDRTWYFNTGDATDINPPTGTIRLLDPDGIELPEQVIVLPSGATATDSTTVKLDLTEISDDYNIPYGIKVWGDNSGALASFEQDASWQIWTNEVVWSLSTNEGTKYILYKLMDSAGNESTTPQQIKILLDTSIPEIYTVLIDSGATHTNDSDRLVSLNITALDSFSGIEEMLISNDVAFTGAEWQDWSPILQEWLLPDVEGSHTFYIKTRDYLGQESLTHSTASIILDRHGPVVSFAVSQVQTNQAIQMVEGSAEGYYVTESYGIAAYQWEQLSGPGLVYFNDSPGDGTGNEGATTEEPWIWATAEGEYFIRVSVTDLAGNSSSATLPFIWDTTAPGNISDLAVAAYNTTGQPNWTWTGVADAEFYRTSFVADFSVYTDVYSPSFTPNTVLAPDGEKILYVRAQDFAGNYSATLSGSVHVDTTAPTIGYATPNFIANLDNNTGFDLDFSGEAGSDGSISDLGDNPSGIASIIWSDAQETGKLSFGSANLATTTVSAAEDGSYQLRLVVTDLAGNVKEAGFTLLRDITPPNTPSLTGPELTPNQKPTWYWNGNGGGIGTFKFRLDDTTEATTVMVVDWTTTTDTSYKPSVLLPYIDSPKTYTITVQELDTAGNWSSAVSLATVVDPTQITAAEITIGDVYPALRNVNSIVWNLLTGIGSSATRYRYDIDNSGSWVESPTPLGDSVPVQISLSGLADGSHSITVQEEVNDAWVIDKTAVHTITVDTVAPSAPVLTGTGLATSTSGRTASADTTPTWSWTPAAGGGGNGKYRYRLTRTRSADGNSDGTQLVALTPDTTSTNYTAAVLSDGTYLLEVQERDDAGNWSGFASQLTTIDTVLPTISSVVIQGTSNPNDSDYTFTNNATVSIVVSGNISSELNTAYTRPVRLQRWNGSTWADVGNWPTGTPTATTLAGLTLTSSPTYSGSKIEYVRLMDEAGNATFYLSDTITLDLVAPSGTFSINSGATTTPSLSFYMSLSAADNLSSASDIEVSLYNMVSGVWGPYRSYSASMLSDSQLSTSPGGKTTKVRFRDGAGNVSAEYSDSISLEVVAPTHAAKGQYTGGYTYVYYIPVIDPAGGTNPTQYYIYSTTQAGANPNAGDPVTYRYSTTSTSSSYVPIPKGELHYIFVRAYDADTGGFGPYSAASVLGFSSNVTVVYDSNDPYDVDRANQIRSILLTSQKTIDLNSYLVGVMPSLTVTLLPENLISTTFLPNNQIWGDPIIITHGSSFTTSSTYDGRVRNIAASSKGTIAMGDSGAYFLYRVDQNWLNWTLSGTRPSEIDSGNQMILTLTRTAKTRPSTLSENIWYQPLYNNVMYPAYKDIIVSPNIFSINVGRRGVYIPTGTNPSGGYIYAGDTYSDFYFPVVRQGEFCYFGYYEIPNVLETGEIFLINLVARMAVF